MNIAGIVVEYNPLHFGHVHHINETKRRLKPDVLIAVMSGHVLQRGEFSIVNKFERTQWALQAGVDLVIELPGLFSLQSADLFAYTSVALLHKLGVSDLCFGSESGEIAPLESISNILDSKIYNERLKHYLNQGKSYPTSSNLALKDISNIPDYDQPNNILGIQYIKAIQKLKSPMKPHTIKRIETDYYDDVKENTHIQSATAIRNLHASRKDYTSFVPDYVYKSLKQTPHHLQNHWFPYMSYRLAHLKHPELHQVFGFTEGLEHLFLKHFQAKNYDDLIKKLTSARYTKSKIKRALMHMLIGTNKSDLTDFNPPYIRVLGMSKTGQNYLNQIKKDIETPLITKIEREKHPYLKYELTITKIYDLVKQENNFEKEFNPVIIL